MGGDLITLTVDNGQARTVRTDFADTLKVALQKLVATNLEALLNNLGSILIGAVLSSEAQDMINSSVAITGSAMLTYMLDAPVSELTVGDNIDAQQDLVNTRTLVVVSLEHCEELWRAYLVFVKTVLKDVLDNKAASLAKRNLMPHTTKSFVNIFHNLWW
jgi:uncharacterized protein YunC (DUF1805 family)